jgi:dTDP-4-amino-4,6-dideoxygalactose transaminase
MKEISHVKMGDLSFQTNQIRVELMSKWSSILESSSFIGGTHVREFEAAFEKYLGATHAIGVANGTDALEIILQGLDLPGGSTVLVQANSFIASAEAVLNSGHHVEFFDVNIDYTIDLEDLASKLSQEIKAVVIVHLYGHPQPAREILELLRPLGIPLIEDCAQAHGASIEGQMVGTFGVASAFSFYPGKNLGALGDAGAIVTSETRLAERFRRISNHGRLSKFDHMTLGRNSRLDPIQASALQIKLRRLDSWNARRVENSKRYRERLTGTRGLTLPPEIPGSVYHHFVIQHEKRQELRAFLAEAGIETGLHYPEALTETSYLKARTSTCQKAEALAKRIVSIPVAEHLDYADVDRVADQILRFCELLDPSGNSV